MKELDKLCKDINNVLSFQDEYLKRTYEIMSKELEDEIIKFLRKNGYKPRRTITYAKNLKRKLRKKGLELRIDDVSKIDYNNNKLEFQYRIYFCKINK